jgi:hypothetical protein
MANLLFLEDPKAILTSRNSGSNSVAFLPPTMKEG